MRCTPETATITMVTVYESNSPEVVVPAVSGVVEVAAIVVEAHVGLQPDARNSEYS